MSLRRQHPWLMENVSASLLFWGGMAVLPAYLIQTSLVIRIGQVVLFGALAVVAGKRLQWFYFLTIVFTISVFHLLVPSGVVLATVGGFRITLGALRTGFFKAVTIVGLVFISLVAVRADLKIPGRLGSLVGKVFWSFEQIMEHRHQIEARRPFVSADRLLIGLYDRLAGMDDTRGETAQRKKTALVSAPLGRGAVALVVAIQWVLLFVPLP